MNNTDNIMKSDTTKDNITKNNPINTTNNKGSTAIAGALGLREQDNFNYNPSQKQWETPMDSHTRQCS